jgi:hypothetical protein
MTRSKQLKEDIMFYASQEVPGEEAGMFKKGMTNLELAVSLIELCDKARDTDKYYRNLISNTEESRLVMRRIILAELSGNWDKVDTSPEGNADWWQVTLKNGSVIRVSKSSIG